MDLDINTEVSSSFTKFFVISLDSDVRPSLSAMSGKMEHITSPEARLDGSTSVSRDYSATALLQCPCFVGGGAELQMAAPSPWSFAIAVALAISVLFMVVEAVPPGTDHGIMSIKNNLPYPINIICNSNTETRRPYYMRQNRSLQFDFDTQKHLSWTCTFQSEGPDGTFIMWKSPAAGGPGNLCIKVCQWRVDSQGLKVLRNGTGHTVLVYVWH